MPLLEKYFIAVVPPEPLLTSIQEIKNDIFQKYQTKGALRSPGHITLHMPFSFNGENETKLVSCLEEFSHKTTFDISLDGYASFEPRVIYINVLQNQQLYELQKKLVKHVKQRLNLFNQSDDLRGFHPHVTVAFRDLKKANFYNIWEEYKNKPLSESFKCNSISILKHGNGKWDILKEFKFQ